MRRILIEEIKAVGANLSSVTCRKIEYYFNLLYRYENDNNAARFTEQQLSEIRKVTLSKILCENFDQNSDIQRAAFDLPSNFL